MKKLFFLLSAQTLLVFGDTIYVDNDTSHPADYRDLPAALAAAQDDDVIMLAPSPIAYTGSVTVTKRLTIKGNGFGGDAPPNLLGIPTVAKLSGGTLAIGGNNAVDAENAEGTVVEGLLLLGNMQTYSRNCLVKRCEISGTCSVFAAGVSFEGCILGSSYTTDLLFGVSSFGSATSGHVRNSIIRGRVTLGTLSSATFDYCVFRDSISTTPASPAHAFKASVLRNCIIGSHLVNPSDLPIATFNCLFIDGKAIYNGAVNCLTGVTSDTFTFSGDWGAYYQIKAGSAALTASTTGGEIGIFGGPTPFKVGGYPPVPRVLRAEMISANPDTGITFQVEAEARD